MTIFEKPGNKNRITLWLLRILMGVSALIFVLYLGGGIVSAFTGFHFLLSTSYGWDAMVGFYTIFAYLCWPALLISLLILIGGTIYFHRVKKHHVSEE